MPPISTAASQPAHAPTSAPATIGLRANSAVNTGPYGQLLIPGCQWATWVPQCGALGVYGNGDSWQNAACGPPFGCTFGSEFQCTQLGQRYAYYAWGEPADWYGVAGSDGSASSMWDAAPNLPVPLQQFPNGGGTLPQTGDLMIFGPGWLGSYWDGAGHVAVVTGVAGGYVAVVEQNGPPSGSDHLPISGTTVSAPGYTPVRGWLRPRDWSPLPFGLYAVDGVGNLDAGSSLLLSDGPMWNWNIARGVAVDATGKGGVVLDGWGGMHPVGTTVSASGSDYWPNFDIAVGIAETPNNQGWYLDGYGGLHPFSTNGAPLPAYPNVTAYWSGWRIARGLAVFADGSGGVVLDGFGGVHPFTVPGDGQPVGVQTTAYWPGWDIARGIVLLPGSTYTHYSGYVLDGWGGLHPFGGAPPLQPSGYWPNWDIARGIAMVPGSSTEGYVVDGFGGLHQFGGAPYAVASEYQPGQDVIRGLAAGGGS